MHGSFDLTTTIVFAILAIIVIWKLRSVLGTRTGNERRPPIDPFQSRARTANGAANRPYPNSEDDNKIVRLPGAADVEAGQAAAASAEPDPDRWKDYAAPDSKIWAALDAVRAADPNFDAKAFVEGARIAYEMIVAAFAKGDRNTLKSLLSKEVFESFSTAIAEREQHGEKVETTFVSMDKETIEDVQVRGNIAQISVRFLAKLITATRDKNDAVIDGDPEKVVDMIDIWTFARDVTSRDPNWRLVATESEH